MQKPLEEGAGEAEAAEKDEQQAGEDAARDQEKVRAQAVCLLGTLVDVHDFDLLLVVVCLWLEQSGEVVNQDENDSDDETPLYSLLTAHKVCTSKLEYV